MRARFAPVMANKIVSRGNEQVTNFHRTHASIEAVTSTLNSIEVPFFRRLEKHVFALQTIFGMLHVRCGDVCIKTGFIPPFHVQEEKRWIFRALGPMIAESATPLRFCNACLQLSC